MLQPPTPLHPLQLALSSDARFPLPWTISSSLPLTCLPSLAPDSRAATALQEQLPAPASQAAPSQRQQRVGLMTTGHHKKKAPAKIQQNS